MTKAEKIARFDPSGVGLDNGHFIGLPFDESDAETVLLPVPWDVTVSFSDGTATGPQNILDCSPQLDLYDAEMPEAWKAGIYFRHLDLHWLNQNEELRPLAEKYIDYLESGGKPAETPEYLSIQNRINEACRALKNWVYEQSKDLLNKGIRVGIVGGEHSVPLGFLEALSERHDSFGILQIDAHQDLRKAYEGFEFSHASIFYNTLKINSIKQIVQVGIRDHAIAEMQLADEEGERVKVWLDQDIRTHILSGQNYLELCREIISPLPQKVYISSDIDGLRPDLCPNTGTPVPGGLDFTESMLLIKALVDSGRQIIGFDLCEVAGTGHDWDGNVGARVLYKLCNFMTVSNVEQNHE